jgi:GntR family transcriptional regulator of vanillate catabolism
MRTQSDIAASQLRDRIVKGELEPGFHLQEVPLAQELGMSRTPIRAALGLLASEGLLDYAPKRGYLVKRFEMGAVMDTYAVRATLEGMAARLAAERGIDAAAAAAMRACLGEGERLLAKGDAGRFDREAWREMNRRFHLTILEAAVNPVLTEQVIRLQRMPLASLGLFPCWRGPHQMQYFRRSHSDHVRIHDSIVKGQALRALNRMEDHVYNAGEVLQQQSQQGAGKRRRGPAD